mgnify:CR=1 FL=1
MTIADNEDKYEPGKFAMSDIKPETILRTKTKGNKDIDILAMHSKSTKKQMKAKEHVINLDATPKNKRTATTRSESKESRCRMHLLINRNRDDQYYYLSRNSTLEHTGHPFIPPQSLKKK